MRRFVLLSLSVVFCLSALAVDYSQVRVGAERIEKYLPLLEGRNVAVIANHTSFVGEEHLVDKLLSLNIHITKIFAPEHGFRGLADAGSHIKNGTDAKTGLPLISLYGKNKKPSAEQLKGVDIVVFDIQDVGVRFYTYISTMHLAMEACAENKIPFLVLDRPNPNGFYIDGFVLEKDVQSFIGMHQIPIVHGLTVGELAQMINGEKWLKDGLKCDLTVIKCEGYTHKTLYKLPIKPSPNLPNMKSVFFYPTLGLLEGTAVSIGRGTRTPFQCVGKLCLGFKISDSDVERLLKTKQIDLDLVLRVYQNAPKEKFFRSSFNKLSGTAKLKERIKKGVTAKAIRASWEKDLNAYQSVRKKYLLYEDF